MSGLFYTITIIYIFILLRLDFYYSVHELS